MSVTIGIPVHSATTGLVLERALQYVSYPGVNETLHCGMGKNRPRCKTTERFSARTIGFARNPQFMSVPVGGRSDTQLQRQERFIV